jgi:hypothetical protein
VDIIYYSFMVAIGISLYLFFLPMELVFSMDCQFFANATRRMAIWIY